MSTNRLMRNFGQNGPELNEKKNDVLEKFFLGFYSV